MRAGMRFLQGCAGGVLLAFAGHAAEAQVFKCVDATGHLVYSQTPCVAEARELGRWERQVGAVMIPASAAAVSMRPADGARTQALIDGRRQP